MIDDKINNGKIFFFEFYFMGFIVPVFGFLGKWGKKNRSKGNLFWGYCDKYSSGYPSIR
jgi:hypothetical protein